MTANIGEQTPLLHTSNTSEENENYVQFTQSVLEKNPSDSSLPLDVDKSSLSQTSLNIAKMCMGTGTLALPFGACQGGILFNIFGLALITLWNIYCVDRLVKCLDYVELKHLLSKPPSIKKGHRKTSSGRRRMFKRMDSSRIKIDEEMVKDEESLAKKSKGMPQNTNTFGKVAWHAFGTMGVWFVDTVMFILMFGIVIAYLDAILEFMKKTPLTSGSSLIDMFSSLIVIMPLCSIANLQSVAKFSAFGLIFLLGTFCVIAGFGINEFGLAGFDSISNEYLWPKDLTSVSNWFGVVVFSYGIVPFTYNVRESMSKPELMTLATQNALWLVFLVYIVMSSLIPIIFLPGIPKFDGNVLDVLPHGWIPTFLRLTMSLVISLTFPLIVVPLGELMEGKLGLDLSSKRILQISLRFIVILLCGAVSVFVPSFVHVTSFLGCVSVSAVTFVCPPLFHMILVSQCKKLKKNKNYRTLASGQGNGDDVDGDDSVFNKSFIRAILFDLVLTILGIVASVITSILTFKSLINQMH